MFVCALLNTENKNKYSMALTFYSGAGANILFCLFVWFYYLSLLCAYVYVFAGVCVWGGCVCMCV